MIEKIFAVILIVMSTAHQIKCESYCYASDTIRSQHDQMCTKQAYQSVRGNPISHSNIPGCNPKQFYLVSRHGTRLPGTKDMILYRDQIPLIQARILNAENSQLCEGDLDLLRNWKWDENITVENDQYLTEQGWNDLLWLGEAYKRTFPNILTGTYSDDEYVVSGKLISNNYSCIS